MILRGALLLSLLLLAACGSSPRIPDLHSDWERRSTALAAQQHWALSGKIGVRADTGNGAATLEWTQHGGSWRLLLAGTLGMGRLTIDGDDADGISWRDTQGRSGRYADPDALVSELWGWPLPVRALRFWVRGIPQPGVTVDTVDFVGDDLLRFVQSGWQIEASAYRDIDGFVLPTRLRLTGNGATLTLAIRQWKLQAP